MGGLLWALLCCLLSLVAHGATLSVVSPARTVEPGDFALHVFEIANPTDASLEARLAVDVPSGWTTLPIATRFLLLPGEADTVFLTIRVPPETRAGTYTVTLTASWNDREEDVAAEVTVREIAALELMVPSPKDVPPDTSVVYLFTVLNRGNTVDRFLADADSSRGYSVSVDPPELPLAPGERGVVSVTVNVPPTATAGRDRLLLVLRSTAAPALVRETAVFTTILPPDPQRITGHTRAEVDGTISGSLEADLLNGDGRLPLSFSGRAFLLDGLLAFSLEVAGLWRNPPLRFSDPSLTYDRDQARLQAGNVTASLPLLSGLSATGVALEFAQERATLTLLTGWHDTEGRFAGAATLYGNSWQLGTAYREVRARENHVRTLAAWAGHTIGEHVTFEIGGMLAATPAGWDEGQQATLRVEVEPTALLQISWHAVGPGIPSPRANEESISLSGRLTATPFTFRYSTHWVRENPWGAVGDDMFSRAQLTASLDWDAQPWPLAVTALFSGHRVWDRPGHEVEKTHTTGLVLAGGETPLRFRLTGSIKVGDMSSNDLTLIETSFSQRFTLTTGDVESTLTLSQQTVLDPEDNVLERTWDTRVGSRWRNAPHEASLTWGHRPSGASWSVQFDGRVAEQLTVGFTAAASWDNEGNVSALRIGTTFAYAFPWSPPFLPAKGWLEGTVRADRQGVEGAVLAVDNLQVSSDAEGRFLFPPLNPGRYTVIVERLPSGFRLRDPGPFKAIVELDGRTRIEIACEQLSEVRGVVFNDQDRDGTRDPTDPGLANVRVELLENGELRERASTDAAGHFVFGRLSAGEYTVSLVVNTLPARYEPTTPQSVSISLTEGVAAEVVFGAWQRPREVVVLATPPLADFEWTPPIPQAGSPVVFDAGLSLPGDHVISDYQWDFTDDGVIDAEEQTPTWTFTEPGIYWVTLTVVDTQGLDDQLSLPVEITPAER